MSIHNSNEATQSVREKKEADEGHEGDQKKESDEGHEGDERHDGDEKEKCDEGHEGNEGHDGDEDCTEAKRKRL